MGTVKLIIKNEKRLLFVLNIRRFLECEATVKTAVTEAEERLRQHEQELVTSLQGEMTSLRTELETCKHLFEVSNVRFTILVVLVVEFIKCFFLCFFC